MPSDARLSSPDAVRQALADLGFAVSADDLDTLRQMAAGLREQADWLRRRLEGGDPADPLAGGGARDV